MDRSRTGSPVPPVPPERATALVPRPVPLSGSPRQVLARIVPGDPLRVRARVARRLAERRLLLDADRVQLRALARLARGGGVSGERLSHESRVDSCVDAAIDDVSEERASSGAFAELAAPLGLPPETARRACRAFNARPDAERAALWLLAFESRAPDLLAERAGVSPRELERRAARALAAMLAAEEPARVGS